MFRPEGFRYVTLLALFLVVVGGAALAMVESETADVDLDTAITVAERWDGSGASQSGINFLSG